MSRIFDRPWRYYRCWYCKSAYERPHIDMERGPVCPWCGQPVRMPRESNGTPRTVPDTVPGPNPSRRRQPSRRLRDLGDRDGWVCWLCGEPVTKRFTHGDPHRPSADRLLPGLLGGTYDPANLRLAHQSCNAYRAGARVDPFAWFDNSWQADHARREALEFR